MKINDFEKKIEKSKEILDKLMDPQISLDSGMKLYKEGIKELKEANKMLELAKLEFEELSIVAKETK
jgi:exodeoxyribonuclease VII small subunit